MSVQSDSMQATARIPRRLQIAIGTRTFVPSVSTLMLLVDVVMVLSFDSSG